MTKDDWESFRLNTSIKTGDKVRVLWHWNFGASREARKREFVGVLDFIDEEGIIFFRGEGEFHRHMRYKTLDNILAYPGGC